MKKSLFLLLSIGVLYQCKGPDPKKESQQLTGTTVEKIAQQAGIENWNDINEVKFTFDVGKAGRSMYQRHWYWNKKTNDITLIESPDTIHYNRDQPMDDRQREADRVFTNDTYWLIPEFKFATDIGTQIAEKKNVLSPISKDTLNMFTIVYSNTGGYTPGDAYDIFYDQDYKLREWVYRQSNDTTISMMTTFEGFENFNGINIARDHRTPDRMTRIYLRDIEFIK